MIISADLGSSSIYLNEVRKDSNMNFNILIFVFGLKNFEDRCGEGFFAIGDHAKVSRS